MNEITIKIEAPELARAITDLASALSILCVTVDDSSKPTVTEVHTVSDAVGSQEEATPAVAAEEKAPERPSEPGHTIEEVRAAFIRYSKDKGKDKAKELLKKYNAAKVTELATEVYPDVLREIMEG